MGLSKAIKGMKKQLLVTPRHEEFLASTSNVELSEEIAAWVARELTAKQRRRSGTWSSSSLGYCKRQHVYKYLGVPPERGVDADLASIFIHGTWTHLKWQAMGYMAGWLGQTEVPCAMPEYGYTGTIDGILASGDAGWELKSINSRGFRYVMTDGVKIEHNRQIHGYMLATGLRKWSVVYEEKDTQNYTEFVVDYNEAIAADVLAELEVLNDAVRTTTLPRQLTGCMDKATSTYRQCAFRDICEEGRWPHPKLVIKRSQSSTS